MKILPIVFISGFFILAIILVFLFSYFVSQENSSQTLKSQAQSISFCDDKCKGFDRCDFSSTAPNGDPNYNDPCCEQIRKTGDPFACPWPQRGYCTDDQCASIPADVNRQRCGGPRHSWCNMCRDAQCPGYVTAPLSTPSVYPSSLPIPITTMPQPTLYQITVAPTTVIPFLPTEEPTPTIVVPTPFEFPSFNLPQINIDIQKPLGFFERIFVKIKYYDQLLETTINNKIHGFFSF